MRTKTWTYQTTHPWITFQLDPASFTPELWVLLGECQSKCEHVAGVPLLPATSVEIAREYLAKGIRGTTSIEGNTLTEEEVQLQLEGKLDLPRSQEYLAKEVENVAKAYARLTQELKTRQRAQLSEADIRRDNRLILAGLQLKSHVEPGEYRKIAIAVGLYRGVPHEECPYLTEKACAWINGISVIQGHGIANAFVRAVMAHLYLAWIHPFGDGNGRTARLAELQILLAAGVPEPATHLLSDHYNRTRTEYYDQLEATSVSQGNVVPFLTYSAAGFRDALASKLKVIRAQQWEIMWQQFVHEQFRNLVSESQRRQKHMVLDLSLESEPVPFSEIRHLSPRVAESYARKTNRTIQRDLHALKEMELISETDRGYAPSRDRILAFLPYRSNP